MKRNISCRYFLPNDSGGGTFFIGYPKKATSEILMAEVLRNYLVGKFSEFSRDAKK
jgi:hypothetical protein